MRVGRESESDYPFQSLKGFQRFCGTILRAMEISILLVSIPKRVSEVLWP